MSELSELSEASLSVADVARELRLSEPTVRRMVASGRIPGFRPGWAYRVAPGALAEFVSKSRTDSGDVAGGAAGSNEDDLTAA